MLLIFYSVYKISNIFVILTSSSKESGYGTIFFARFIWLYYFKK